MRTVYCKVCCRMLPADRFTSTGRAARVCRSCKQLPPTEQHRRQALDELAGFVRQKNLSGANVTRLKVLTKSSDTSVARQAAVLLEVATLHPHLSRRLEWLQEKHPALHAAYVDMFGIAEPAAASPVNPPAQAGGTDPSPAET